MFEQLKTTKAKDIAKTKEKAKVERNERRNYCHQRFVITEVRFFKV